MPGTVLANGVTKKTKQNKIEICGPTLRRHVGEDEKQMVSVPMWPSQVISTFISSTGCKSSILEAFIFHQPSACFFSHMFSVFESSQPNAWLTCESKALIACPSNQLPLQVCWGEKILCRYLLTERNWIQINPALSWLYTRSRKRMSSHYYLLCKLKSFLWKLESLELSLQLTMQGIAELQARCCAVKF